LRRYTPSVHMGRSGCPRAGETGVHVTRNTQAVVAFELARELRRRRCRQPTHLFVGARRAPHLSGRSSSIHKLPDQQFIEQINARYEPLPKAALQDPEMLRLVLSPIRADMRALETYVFREEPRLEFPITVFSGSADVSVRPEEVMAWREHTSKGFAARTFPGGHFLLNDYGAPILDSICEQLRTAASRGLRG
ncbi:MAG: thioesterase domain-containing protein, partial [Myxococcales bacterium]|nr:thioesterase domain-containing protein [Myxococcales bacterium]